MNVKNASTQGFTLVEIMIVVAVIGLLAALAVPNFARARGYSQANTCIENLRQIDSAVQQWALETGKATSLAADPNQIIQYLNPGTMPKCPTGAEYEFSDNIGATPTVTCPTSEDPGVKPLHVLPDALL